MFSALKKFGQNVKKAGKSVEGKFEKAGTAMKEAASGNSPSKSRKKEDHKNDDRKTHDTETKSKKSKRDHEHTETAHSDRGSEEVSLNPSEVGSTAPSVPRRAPSGSSQRSKADTAKEVKSAKSESKSEAKSEAHSEVKVKTPRSARPATPPPVAPPATAQPARASSPSPSDIAFQIDDVSPGQSLERPPSFAAVSRGSSIQIDEVEEPTPVKTAVEPKAAAKTAAPAGAGDKPVAVVPKAKKTATVVETPPPHEQKEEDQHSADGDGSSIHFDDDNNNNGDDGQEIAFTQDPSSPELLKETVRGTTDKPPAAAAADTASASVKTAQSASTARSATAATGTHPRETQSTKLKKRQVTIGDRDSAPREERTDAVFARTEMKRAEVDGEKAPSVQARRTADARYRSGSTTKPDSTRRRPTPTGTATTSDAPTPERRRQPAREAPVELPDNSSTYVSPAKRRHSRDGAGPSRAAERDSVEDRARPGEHEDLDEGVDLQQSDRGSRRQHRRHHRRHHGASQRDASASDSVDSTPRASNNNNENGDDDDDDRGDVPRRAPARQENRTSRPRYAESDTEAAPLPHQRRDEERRASRRPRASPLRRRSGPVDSRDQNVAYNDPLDYRAMMAQCRRDARALSQRRARQRVAYASESDGDSYDDRDARYAEEDEAAYDDAYYEEDDYPYPNSARRRRASRRHRGFRDVADDEEYDYDDIADEDAREYTPHMREHYRGQRRFPSGYSAGPPKDALRSLPPDEKLDDRVNVGRFYPSMIHDGPPSLGESEQDLYERAHRGNSGTADGRRHDSRGSHRRAGSNRNAPDSRYASRGSQRVSPVRRPRRSPPRPQSQRSAASAGGGYSSREHTPRRSPLRGRSSLYASPYEAQSLVPSAVAAQRRRSPNQSRLTPTRPRSASVTSGTSAKLPQSEEALLEEIEFKMGLLAEQIAFEDEVREVDMRRSPFERLYHMNNRRDRDERRERLAQYHKLEKARDKLITGAFEKDMAAKEAKRAADAARLTDPDGVFNRLYNTPRRRGTPLRHSLDGSGAEDATRVSGSVDPHLNHSRTSSAAASAPPSVPAAKLSPEALESLCARLYGGAVATARRREEEQEEAEKARQYKEMEDFLVGRLIMEMERKQHGRVLTAEELRTRAQEELQKRMQANPDDTQKALLQGNPLSKRDAQAQATRLLRQGYVSKEALEDRKKKEELTGCTFEPAINEYYFYSTTADRDKSRANGADTASASRSPNTTTTQLDGSLNSPRTRSTHGRSLRTEMLYQRAEKERASAELRRQEYDREMRLRILRSRMASDHHFRRRVELDPSLAERFMKSIVV